MPTPALHISDLEFKYRGSVNRDTQSPSAILNVHRFELSPGEQFLLAGGSGCGKSTLLHLIAGLLDPTRGSIVVAGRAVHSLRGAARDQFRGRQIGMIFQTFNLLHGFSALENVMAALMFSEVPAHKHRLLAADMLSKLDIKDHGKEPSKLSVGQQQRVAVARALVTGPALVLADEPTASLDPENGAAAMDLIQHLCREKNAALLCVSHDPAMSARFDRRAALADLRSPVSADDGNTSGRRAPGGQSPSESADVVRNLVNAPVR